MTYSCSQNWGFNCLSGGFCGCLTYSLTHATERHSEKVALFGVTVCSVLTPNRWWETGSSKDNQPQSIHSYKQSYFSWIQFNTQSFIVWPSIAIYRHWNLSALCNVPHYIRAQPIQQVHDSLSPYQCKRYHVPLPRKWYCPLGTKNELLARTHSDFRGLWRVKNVFAILFENSLRW
jgi:hypothetical protein